MTQEDCIYTLKISHFYVIIIKMFGVGCMENKTYSLLIKTPDGIIKLKINHTVINKDDENMSVINCFV